MAHILGIGTLWEMLGVTGADEDDCPYLAPNAIREWQSLSGCTNAVPTELDGGPGTRCGHFDAECLGREMMTGFLGGYTPIFSRITIGAIADLGYEVASYDDGTGEYTSDDILCCSSGGRRREHEQRDITTTNFLRATATATSLDRDSDNDNDEDDDVRQDRFHTQTIRSSGNEQRREVSQRTVFQNKNNENKGRSGVDDSDNNNIDDGSGRNNNYYMNRDDDDVESKEMAREYGMMMLERARNEHREFIRSGGAKVLPQDAWFLGDQYVNVIYRNKKGDVHLLAVWRDE